MMAKTRAFSRTLSQLDEMIGDGPQFDDGEELPQLSEMPDEDDERAAPMKLLHGKDGRITGATQGGRELRIVRDANGRPVLVEML